MTATAQTTPSGDRGADIPKEAREDTDPAPTENNPKEHREDDFAAFRDLDVSWRSPDMPSGVSPPYGPEYADLRLKALDGDTDAAFSLFSILDECKSAFTTESDVTTAVNELRQTHLLKLPGWEKPLRLRNAEQVELVVGQVEASFDKCNPITSRQKAEKDRWLKVAADGDSIIAKVWYASVVEDHQESMNSALEAWDIGAAQALPVLSERHQELYDRGEDVHGNIKALSYLFAYTHLLSRVRAPSDPRLSEAMTSLKSAKASFHEYQIQEAIEMAVNTIEANSNCCIRF